MQRSVLAVTVGLVLASAGCATIIHGTHQKVAVSSQPTGARVLVDNMPVGVTPIFADLSRSSEHIISIEMQGFEKTQIPVTKSVSGWVLGNLIFGGLIGLAVDAISGGLYSLSPEQLHAELRKGDGSVSEIENGIYIVAVLVPDPAWKQVGSLTPKY